jgi:hypothetical protein
VGQLSLREIGKAHGINHVSIKKRADKEHWPRDLAVKIQAKARSIVNAANSRLTNKANTEDEIVAIKGAEVAQIRLGHQHISARSLSLCQALLQELEDQTYNTEALSQLGELMRNPDDSGSDRLNDQYKKIISTPGRVDTAKKLVETMKTVISLEREAYGINEIPPETAHNSVAAFLAGLKRSALPIVVDVSGDDY